MTLELSRRRLLTVAGLTLGAAWVDLAAPTSPAVAAPVGLTLEPVPDEPVTVQTPAGGSPVAIPRQLAVRVRNDGGELAPGTQVRISFDPRLYAVVAAPAVFAGARKVPATAVTTMDRTTGETVCSVTIGERIPAGSGTGSDLVVLVGTADSHLYPHDLVASPAPATADLPAAKTRLRLVPKGSEMTAADPWGVELAAGWDRLTWRDGRDWYYYPAAVAIIGTGPGLSPAAEFTVTVDPQVVVALAIASARVNNKPYSSAKIRLAGTTTTATIRQVGWRTRVRLGVGDRLDVVLRVRTRIPPGTLKTITHPVISTAMAALAGSRPTGRLSVSRSDSSAD